MTLAAGTKLGPYEVLSSLGAGGMGEVYRARDTRLGRDVAVKVLPAAFAQDPDRRARFEREAQTVATLSHPNIVSLFDTGVQGEQIFVVMELLAGETLRERLTSGQLPLRKTIEYAIQVAHGLAAAHDKGLVHRDLKPENIFLLVDGQVKILDFGLARSTVEASGATMTVAAMTDPGTVVGTVGYMAPEQVRGQTVDARTDLFAFGAVLYEMLAGRRAFHRETAAEAMTAILKEDPPELGGTGAEISPALDRIIRHCLEKNPVERFQTARDVAFALSALSGSQSSSGALPAAAAAPRWRWPAAIATVAVAAFMAGILLDRRIAPAPSTPKFEAVTFDSQWITRARFGPDGQTVIFSAAAAGNRPDLFVSRPGAITAQSLGQPNTHLLSVSSKGEFAVLTNARPLHHFLFDGTLARMTVDGAPRPWLEHVREADWSPDGSTLAVIHLVDGQDQLEYPIGTALHRSGGYLSDPRVSPDGSRVAFFEHQLAGDNRGWVKSVSADHVVKTLAGEYWGADGLAWSADGRQVVFSASMRGSDPYQALSVNVVGTPIVRELFASPGAMLVQDMSSSGRVLALRHDRRWSIRALLPGETAEREFAWLDFAITGFLTPDRKSLMFSDMSATAGSNYATAMREIGSSKVVRLGEGWGFGLSPDGQWAGSQLPSTGEIVLYPVGPGQPLHVSRGPLETYVAYPTWFPRGSQLLVCGREHERPPRCYAQEPTGTPKSVTPEGVIAATATQDGQSFLTLSTAGTFELLAAGHDRGVAVHGLGRSDQPLGWTPDGRSVIVQAGTQIPMRVERVDITTGARTLIREVAPPDRAGVTSIVLNQWIDQGPGYVYAYQRSLGTLFVVSGVR